MTEGTPIPIPEDLRGLYAQAVADKSGASTTRGFQFANIQRLIERVGGLELQLRDEALAFNHANDVVAKLESDNARLSAEARELAAKVGHTADMEHNAKFCPHCRKELAARASEPRGDK